MTVWQRWLQYPEKSRVRNAAFQIHYWMGMGAALYVLLMSISGSMIVYRNELSKRFSIEWLVNLHENLLFGSAGRLVNGIGATGLTLLCLTGAIIWWPGIKHWRRSLTVNWRAHFARISWDVHSALGFWFFSLFWCGDSPGSIFLSQNFLVPCYSLIPLTILLTKACFGSPSCILEGSAGSSRVFGLFWDLYLPS